MLTIFRAGLARPMHDQRPQVHVGDGGVRAPVDDVTRMQRRIGIDDRASAERDVATRGARRRTDGAIEQRGAQAMEEPPIKAGAVQLPHRAGVAVRQDRLRAVLGLGDRVEFRGDAVNRFIPSDADEIAPAPFGPAAGALDTSGGPDGSTRSREIKRVTFWHRKPSVNG